MTGEDLISGITLLRPQPGDLILLRLGRQPADYERAILGIFRMQLKEQPALDGMSVMVITPDISVELLNETDMRNAGWQRIPAAE